MPITMNDLTINFDDQPREQLLSDWEWAMDESMLPVLITAMGDVFAQGQSGAVYFLDVACGTIEGVAQDGPSFKSLLNDSGFVTERMYPSRIVEFRKAGLTLGPGEVYSHKQPLALGGEDVLENYETTNVAVHLSINGQIHQQIKDLPPGTAIENIQIE
jgi:hypothetical protein